MTDDYSVSEVPSCRELTATRRFWRITVPANPIDARSVIPAKARLAMSAADGAACVPVLTPEPRSDRLLPVMVPPGRRGDCDVVELLGGAATELAAEGAPSERPGLWPAAAAADP